MATVHDVAAYILKVRGLMTAMKLQKLVYYAQAWNLVWERSKLFPERIEAWANGPVVVDLYRANKGQFQLGPESIAQGNPDALTECEKDTVNVVLDLYGDKTSQWLSDLTHMEKPWKDARRGLAPGDRGDVEITPDDMVEYYSSIGPADATHRDPG